MERQRQSRFRPQGLGSLGSTSQATSDWVSDPAACTVRFRGSHSGQVDADTVENGVAILFNVTTSNDRGSTVESSMRPAASCTPSRSDESSALDLRHAHAAVRALAMRSRCWRRRESEPSSHRPSSMCGSAPDAAEST